MVSNIKASGYNFRYNTKQWLAFASFMDFVYEQQRQLDDDLPRIVILRSVAQSQISHDRGVNASSLADALNLPRETVRRKCLTMVEDGWLKREGDAFRLGERLGPEVFSIYEENIERLMMVSKDIQAGRNS